MYYLKNLFIKKLKLAILSKIAFISPLVYQILKMYGIISVTSGEMVTTLKGNLGLVLNSSKYLVSIITFKSNSFKVNNIIYFYFSSHYV